MKGTSPSQASGEAFTASQSGVKMEIPVNINHHSRGEVMNKIITVVAQDANSVVVTLGIDLAKDVFALHGVNAIGKPILVKPNVRRKQLLDVLAKLPPCVVGMEACSGAHHWARQLLKLGHTPKLMAPKFVIPYRIQGKQGKNDANDAALLILGARSVLAKATSKSDRISRGAIALATRVGYGKALVAIAAKNARMAWAMLAKSQAFAPAA
jgi:hypothetical protein